MNITPTQQDITEANNSGLLDKGWYTGRIIEAEEGVNNSGNPKISIKHLVTEGDRSGSQLYTTYHNPEVNAIARSTMVQLIMATGLQSLTNPAVDLPGREIDFYVGIKKASPCGMYPEGREVKKYRASTGQAQTVAPPQQPVQAPPAQPAPQEAPAQPVQQAVQPPVQAAPAQPAQTQTPPANPFAQ